MISKLRCPICHKDEIIIIGTNEKGEKLTSCGHAYHFKKTKSQKMMDKKYVSHPWGLELA